ncbi:MAG: hypothetical protein ABR605_04515, partial [Desulfurivibrionaceae bacterium]
LLKSGYPPAFHFQIPPKRLKLFRAVGPGHESCRELGDFIDQGLIRMLHLCSPQQAAEFLAFSRVIGFVFPRRFYGAVQ